MSLIGPQRLKDLFGIEYPIIQGPFGGGSSSVALVKTVSEEGGLGSFSAADLSPSEILALVEKIRAETKRSFAINLWVSDHDEDGLAPSRAGFERSLARVTPFFRELGIPLPSLPEKTGQRFSDQIPALLEARPPVFSFVFGVPSPEILEECRKRGIKTIGTATTADEAIALDRAGADAIVASSFEAGGHRGSFLRPAEESLSGNFSLVPKIVERVKVPVVAAGGIADARGITAALALGASGVQIGTAFLACDESGANPVHREQLHTSATEQTTLTRVYTGRLARGIRNRLVEELHPHVADALPYPAQSWLLGHLKREAIAKNRPDLMSLWAGQAAPLLHHRSAAKLFRELVTETRKHLTALATAAENGF